MTIRPVELEKSYRLLNHGPTTLVSAKYHHIENVMSASWVTPLDFAPIKLTAILDKQAYTRKLIEQSGLFAIQIPIASQVESVISAGTLSRHNNDRKLIDSNISLFYQEGYDVPLVEGCAAWMICKLIPEEHHQQAYDLFIGEVIGAWADDKLFSSGHWHFDEVSDDMKTLHYIAGGQFYLIGKGLKTDVGP